LASRSFVRKGARCSGGTAGVSEAGGAQIEGTQSTLDDVLAFETDADRSKLPRDMEEMVNYVSAMNYGLARLETLPLSPRLRLHRPPVISARTGRHR
jgi:Fic/DOC family N-terminal